MKEEDFINDKFLQDALFRLETNYFEKRKHLEKIFDYELYKNLTQKIKKKNINALESNTQSLIKNLKKKNINVIFAENAHQAQDAMLKILQNHDAKYVVKSKSLTTEEIHLNEFLKQNGIEAYETDLGEWLVQIANQPSSHMTAPAIHMSKEKICNLLNEKFSENLSSDLDELVQFSKNKIREYFDYTRIGIFGSNVVSKDGVFFIISNEGNVEKVLLNDVNICIVGIDKIVSNTQEALNIVDFLPKAATAQLSTSYVDCFEKPFGEFHVILLDNGRSTLSKNAEFSPILQCIRCGACQNACCVYTSVSGLAFRGDAYAGPIGVLLSYLTGYKDIGEFANFCLGCMACDSICSSKIPIQSLILKIKSLYPINNIIKDKILDSLSNYSILRLSIRILSKFFKNQTKFGFKAPDEYFGFDFRALPKPNKRSFDLTKTHKSSVGLFAGCSVNIFYEDLGKDCLNIGKKLNINVSVIKQPACCGAACYYNGKQSEAINSAKKVSNTIENFDEVIFLDPHCQHMIDRDYFEIAGIDLEANLQDASSYFLKKINKTQIKPMGKKITYHHPCHLLRGLKTSLELEVFLREIEPQFVELNESDKCCGFAGSYSIMHKGISKKLVERKAQNIINTHSEILITACPGCIMQIDGYLKNKGINIKVMHFVSYLNAILGG
ncbi:putative L-lactate dehydrogenase, Iron-sulfur cluster-binding subunit YkgF [Desulfurella amilsii]|uniref:Putative L-lactate dehydrogenase, Iron-sulfur cluster-binding subunit YkgF n=1 Tax=Desulfurella amilsii TaxID=1562698 RepID=A0A1X4XW17_9BACT|nr:LUD domain-containing protein [Desulfurella amilsii]OSS41714.1 putative L-lactate dehydrogenase, Iron-sulfur cluster-binding subunit YkgF [Desulfurella amilsii]